jgi:hypothetical protein
MTEIMGCNPGSVNFRVPRLRTDRDRVELLLAISNSLLFLIENPEKQAFGALALDAEHQEVATNSPNAACWCALGRIAHDFDIGFDPLHPLIGCTTTEVVHTYYLEPVGLHKAMFIKANDMFPEIEYRTRALKDLRARVIAKIDDLMPQGRYA